MPRISDLLLRKQVSAGALLLALALGAGFDLATALAQDRTIPDMPPRPRVPAYDPGQPVLRKTLKNGVRLLVQEQRTGDRIAGVVGLRMGTRYETEDESGLSQILMRTLITGTESRNPTQLHLEILAADARLEASAGPDMGQISIVTQRERTTKALELLADVILHPSFPDTAFASARASYVGKANDELESPIPATYAIFLRTMYRGSAFERPAYGRLRTIAECRRSDIVALHRKYFVGGNLTVAFVGNLDAKKFMAQLEKAFAGVPAGPAPEPFAGNILPLATDTLVIEERAILAQSLVFGYPAPGYDDPDYPAFLVLDSYLRSGDRSPIAFWLPERRLATGVGVLYPRYPQRSSIAVYLGATPANWKAARDTVAAVFGRLKTEPLDQGEWVVHVRRAQNGFLLDQTNPLVRARDLTRHETQGLGLDYPKRFEDRLLALKPEDVRAAAARWFTHSCKVTLMPLQSGSRP